MDTTKIFTPSQPQESLVFSYCVGEGAAFDHCARRHAAFASGSATSAGAQEGDLVGPGRGMWTLEVRWSGIYRVSAGLSLDGGHEAEAWGVTLNSHLVEPDSALAASHGFILAWAPCREVGEDDGPANRLSWIGFLERGDVLRTVVEPPRYSLCSPVFGEGSGFLRAHYLGGG